MRIRFDNYAIETCENVYEPAEDSFALIDAIDSIGLDGGTFVDVGCGTGIVGIHVAKKYGSEVIFSDINPYAVRCAKRNAHINNIKGHYVVGNLLDRLDEADYAAFNPPYLPGEPEDIIDYARSGGEDGLDAILGFINQLDRIRKLAFILTTSFNPQNVIENALKSKGLDFKVILRRIISGEEYIIRAVYRRSLRINLNRDLARYL